MGIFKVRYNDNEKKDYITSLWGGFVESEDGYNISKIGKYAIWSKEQIIDMLTVSEIKVNVFTVIKNESQFIIGDEVEKYTECGKTYLRTKGNSKKEDNLGCLETF